MNRGRRQNRRNQPEAAVEVEESASNSDSENQSEDEAESAQIEIDECTKKVVLYILNFSASKLPIKRFDIIKACANGKHKLFKLVYPQICADLKYIYGIILHEIQIAPKQQRFICTSSFAASNEDDYLPGDKEKLVLLTLILSFIFMRGGLAKEPALFQFLTDLHIPLFEPHHYFGTDIKKLVTETFTRQLYLNRKKIDSTANVEEIGYKWGERSNLEFDKAKIFHFACKILGKPIQSFQKQYLEVYEQKDINASNVLGDGVAVSANALEGDLEYTAFI